MPRTISKRSARKTKGKTASATRAGSTKQPKWVNVSVAWPQPKQAISLRIDQDVLAWFRDRGPGYQTRMNAVLRAFVDAQHGRR